MAPKQKGFTLIEIVVAFTILAMGSILAVNIITQSSIRVNKVNEYLEVINVLESAVAMIRSELIQNRSKKTFHGMHNGGYEWGAKILKQVDDGSSEGKRYITLYHLQIRVFHGEAKQRIVFNTVISDR